MVSVKRYNLQAPISTMNITYVGARYVGYVTGTCFAETGINVFCIDREIVREKQEAYNSI